MIRVFDMVPSASRQNEPILIQNKIAITRVAVSRAGHADHQCVVFIDANRDAFCAINVNASMATSAGGVGVGNGGGPTTLADVYKIGSQVSACMWGADSNMLVGLHDAGSYSVWYCPAEACADPTLVALTTGTVDASEFGRAVSLVSFEGAVVRFGSNGITYAVQVNVYCDAVHRLLAEDRWQQALQVCRRSQVSGNFRLVFKTTVVIMHHRINRRTHTHPYRNYLLLLVFS